jgi:phosphoglycolate phosphatase
MQRLIVFDCDGTLVDSQHLIVAAAGRAFVAHGLAPPPAPAVRAVIGLSLEIAFAELHPDSELALRAMLVDSYRIAWRALREEGVHEPLYPGAIDGAICSASPPASRGRACCTSSIGTG